MAQSTTMASSPQYSQPFTRDYERLQSKITAKVCAQLQEDGFVVIDDCFGAPWATALLDEMKWLHAHELFKPNKTQFALTQQNSQQVFQFVKPNIYEVDLHDASIRTRVPELDALFHSTALIEALARHLPKDEYDLQMKTSGRTLKLQRNAGQGGCFPCHYDNPGKPNKRKLTCLLYLNDAWKEGDGGEVQLLPFLKAPVTVAPKMDRVVIFQSDWMLHRVLPNNAERYCLTIWVDGSDATVNRPEDTALRLTQSDLSDDWLGFLERLRKSPVQRLLSRGVYEEEYLESLTQCMGSAPEGYPEMLRSHETHLANLQRNKPLYDFIQRLRMTRELNSDAPRFIN